MRHAKVDSIIHCTVVGLAPFAELLENHIGHFCRLTQMLRKSWKIPDTPPAMLSAHDVLVELGVTSASLIVRIKVGQNIQRVSLFPGESVVRWRPYIICINVRSVRFTSSNASLIWSAGFG